MFRVISNESLAVIFQKVLKETAEEAKVNEIVKR